MDLVVVDASAASLLAIAGDPVLHLAEPGQGFHVDVNQVTRPLPLVLLHPRVSEKLSPLDLNTRGGDFQERCHSLAAQVSTACLNLTCV